MAFGLGHSLFILNETKVARRTAWTVRYMPFIPLLAAGTDAAPTGIVLAGKGLWETGQFQGFQETETSKG